MLVWQSYQLLCRDRPIGLAVGPIPWSAIDRFITTRLRRGWIDAEEAIALEALIIALDDDDIGHRAKSKPKPEEGGQDDDDSNGTS